jgi:hypothetical protein
MDSKSFRKGMEFVITDDRYFWIETPLRRGDIEKWEANCRTNGWYDCAGEPKLPPLHSIHRPAKGDIIEILSARGAGKGRVTVRVGDTVGVATKRDIVRRCTRVS